MTRLECVAVVLLSAVAVAAVAAPPSVVALLLDARAASGGNHWDAIRSLRTEGDVQRGGTTERFRQVVNPRTGQWVATSRVGPLQTSRGYDGKAGWDATPSGAVFRMDTPHAERVAVAQAFRNAYAWWEPRRWPAALRFLGVRASAGRTYDVVRITPRGGTSFELWLDARTHLVARVVNHDYAQPLTVYYSDYQAVRGVKIPFRRRVAIGRQRDAAVVEIDRVQVNVPVRDAAFAPPVERLVNFTFAGNAAEATIPFALPDSGDIIVRVRVNGHPMRFVVDTGSGDTGFITARAAAIAGVHGVFIGNSAVVGTHRIRTGLGVIKQLSIGGKVTLHDEPVRIDALPDSNIDGSLGADFFARFVVRIDYRSREMTLMRPHDFKTAGAGIPVPLLFYRGGIPVVEGTFDGFGGLFDADTGDGRLLLMTPFARTRGLYARYRAKSVAVTAPALGGGRVPFLKTRGGTLVIGTLAVHDPLVQMSPAGTGFLANRHLAGIVGGRVFAHFVTTFDYAAQKLYLKPQS